MQTATHLDFVSIQVLDMQKSEAFYTETLGFKKGQSPNPHAVVFDTGDGAIFAIRPPLTELESTAARGTGIALWFRVPDADALYQQVFAKGVQILQPIEDGPFGRVFTLQDPEGYAITLHGATEL